MSKHQTQKDDSLPTISLILGITSLLGPGFLLGIPAIITGAIALKKNQENQGFSIAGIVTGSISTVVSLLILVLIVLAVIWAVNTPELIDQPLPTDQLFESSAT